MKRAIGSVSVMMALAMVACMCVFAPVAHAAPSSTPDTDLWMTNGTVRAVVDTGATTYIGGDFTVVGPNTGRGSGFDMGGTGAALAPYLRANSDIYCCIADGAGGFYIGGAFTRIGGVTRNRIAHIMPDMTLDTTWNSNANEYVWSLCLSGTTLYVGGGFTGIGGQVRNYIAALDTTTGNATAWNPSSNNVVHALAVSGTNVYAGGIFTIIGGQVRNRIAAIDTGTGLATAWNPNSNNAVYALALSGTTLYAGGLFTNIGGQVRNYIAALDTTTGNATAWNPNSNNIVRAIAVSGTNVYAGGAFTVIGGQPRYYLAAIDSGTGLATAWNPTYANGIVWTVAVSGANVYAGGQFTTIGGQVRNRIAALDSATGQLTAWDPNSNGIVRALAVSGANVYAGGDFWNIGGQARNRIAAIDTGTGLATAWNPNSNLPVYALAVSGTNVYAGGAFTVIGGQPKNYIAALDTTTGLATVWGPNANAAVYGFALSGGIVYVCGVFTNIGAQPRNYIAALDATGAATAWNPNANNHVVSLAVSGANVYAGGYFTGIGGQERNYVAALDTGTGNATAWNPQYGNAYVWTVAVSGGIVYVGGAFTKMGGQERNYLAAIDQSTGNATGWIPNPNSGVVYALAASGTNVYAGGAFTVIGGESALFLARFGNLPPDVTGISPAQGARGQSLTGVSIIGKDFRNTAMTVELRRGAETITGTNVVWLSGNEVKADFNLAGATAANDWDVYVRHDDDGKSDTLTGAFTVTQFTAGASVAGGNGTVVPLTQNVDYGASATVNVTPNSGYHIASITDNGTPQVIANPYVINNVTANHNVVVTFAIDTFAVNASVSGGNGTVTPATQSVPYGANANVNITPNSGYYIVSITDNGVNQVIANPYVITNVTANHNVVVTFINNTPEVESVSPSSGLEGAHVTIKGSNFGAIQGDSFVTFNGKKVTQYVSWSDGEIVVIVPEGETGGAVVVNTGMSFNSDRNFTLLHPTWYLAEGSTAWGFSTYITIQNPNDRSVTARVTYMKYTSMDPNPDSGGGVEAIREIKLPEMSQTTIDPAETLGEIDFSTKVECLENKNIAVDRTMYWTGKGASSQEGHSSIGAPSPSRVWYLPEGSSNHGFETWTLILNPNLVQAQVDLTYMIDGETPKVFKKIVPAQSRATYSMEQDIGSKDASVEVSSDQPVITERTMYRNNQREGHCSIGATALAQDYYLAEGSTAWGFTTYVLIQNPNDLACDVTVTYMTSKGDFEQKPFTMPANSRRTVRVNDVLPEYDVSTLVHGSAPIIAERAMYWDSGTGEACHDSIGMSAAHKTFYLPDGQTSNGRETFTLIQNPNDEPVTVEISYIKNTPEDTVVFKETIGARSRRNYSMADKGVTGRATTIVRSLAPGKKIMVERSMYWNNKGAGTDTIGGYSD